jgi:S-formylglutathione hydrolase FrmB
LNLLRSLCTLLAAAVLCTLPYAAGAASRGAVLVTLGPGVAAPEGGRLIVFASPHQPAAGKGVDFDFLDPHAVYVTSIDIASARAGETLRLPFDRPGFPAALASAPAGTYYFSAYLDVNRHFAYTGNAEAGDLAGAVASGQLGGGAAPHLVLDHVIPGAVLNPPPGIAIQRLHSTMLSAFHGSETTINAVVVEPSGVKPGTRVPTVFIVGGYGTTLASIVNRTAPRLAALKRPLYFVLLDPEVPLGHSVFADSQNNGPWGTALVKEAIPALEAMYPGMLAEPRGRFLTGHSSGGWTTLWLQITYPEFFGGTWSTSPDPVDFHNFTGPDLLAAPQQNMYVDAAGKPYNLVRYHGRELMTLKEYVDLENVEGAQGGQFASFNAVFGPRGRDGFPVKLFNRATGAIDPAIVRVWEHYDIAAILRAQWPTLGPKLAGKLHIVVGAADTFHLNEGVALLATELRALGSDAQITFVPGRDHFDLYDDGLQGRIFDAMEARAAATGVVPAPH